MRQYSGVVYEIRYEPGSLDDSDLLQASNRPAFAWIACPAEAVPAPGQYLLGWSPLDGASALASALFPSRIDSNGFLTASPTPPGWGPGTPLELRGPIGHGFSLPAVAQRLALAAFGNSAARLQPVIDQALDRNRSVALFCRQAQPNLPAAVEIYPLHELGEALQWPDLLLIDIPIGELDKLRAGLGLKPEDHIPCPAQVLVATTMPCGGLAECGACFVPVRRGWRQTCQDGPVFDLNDLQW